MYIKNSEVIKLRQQTASRSKEFWTEEEREELMNMFNTGIGITEMAIRFGWTEMAIVNQINAMNLYHRVRASRRKREGCLCENCSLFQECQGGPCLKDAPDSRMPET